ncbi:MAG: hypothetical protein V1664_04670 [Candidatus Uhrbacteria bacterium]
MHKKLLFPIIIALAAIAVIGLFVFLIKAKNAPPPDSTMIFFYRDDCPHCKNVEDFFAANNVENQIAFEKREVRNSPANAKLLSDRFTRCNITDPKQMGVPLFWDGSTCFSGDQPIIDYFKTKLGI